MKGLVDPAAPMRRYAAASVNTLIRRLAFQINRAGKRGDADSIHDLRVAIRRLSQALAVFAPLLPRHAAGKVRHKIDELRRLAGGVRDLDIAIEYSRKTPGSAAFSARLNKLRKQALRELTAALLQASRREPWRKWRRRLEIES
jgi:CHAD domain-containing protein